MDQGGTQLHMAVGEGRLTSPETQVWHHGQPSCKHLRVFPFLFDEKFVVFILTQSK